MVELDFSFIYKCLLFNINFKFDKIFSDISPSSKLVLNIKYNNVSITE